MKRPSLAEVRGAFIRDDIEHSEGESAERFDAWLTDHTRAADATAWADGFNAARAIEQGLAA